MKMTRAGDDELITAMTMMAYSRTPAPEFGVSVESWDEGAFDSAALRSQILWQLMDPVRAVAVRSNPLMLG